MSAPADGGASRVVVLFVRAPEPGRVKTRLAAELGAAEALRIYRELGARAAAAARGAHAALRVAHTPDDGAALVHEWLGPDLTLWPQGDGDLGARLTRAVGRTFAEGAARVVVVGSDCPALDAALLDAAFDRLDAADVVLGPASDGGYYLIGLRAPQPALFADIPWSAPTTRAATLAAANGAGLSVSLLQELTDVDTAADWRRWQGNAT